MASLTLLSVIPFFDKSPVAEHAWKDGDHQINWDDVDIIDRAQGMTERRVKEAIYIYIGLAPPGLVPVFNSHFITVNPSFSSLPAFHVHYQIEVILSNSSHCLFILDHINMNENEKNSVNYDLECLEEI